MSKLERVLLIVQSMTEEERRESFDALDGEFCFPCGMVLPDEDAGEPPHECAFAPLCTCAHYVWQHDPDEEEHKCLVEGCAKCEGFCEDEDEEDEDEDEEEQQQGQSPGVRLGLGCELCRKPAAYPGARFCGAACSAQYEAGKRPLKEVKSFKTSGPR